MDVAEVVEILKNKCCIFIGAGIPNSIGFPLWKKLAEDIVEFTWSQKDVLLGENFSYSLKAELQRHIYEGQLISAITYCRDRFRSANKERTYQAKIIEWLHDKEKYALTRSNPVYRHLDTLTKNTVVLQTNLDKSLERHCNFTTYLNINLPANLPASCLIYLHGEITNPSSWILTRDEYDDFYQRQKTPGFVSFIENIFKQKDVLFLGYSLNDKEILDQIAKVKGSGRKYVLVLGEMELEKVRNQIWEQNLKHHEINVVRYDIEKEGYDAFSAFLGSITSLIRPPVQVASADEEGDSLYAQ